MTISPHRVTSLVEIKEGDSARILYDTLTFDGQYLDLTYATASLYWLDNVSGTRETKSITVINAVSGSVSYQLTDDDVAESGTRLLEWSIRYNNGKVLRVPTAGYVKLNIVGDIED